MSSSVPTISSTWGRRAAAGTIVATGTPEQANPNSFTGQYLKPVLERAWKLQGTAPAPVPEEPGAPGPQRKKPPAQAQTQKSRQKITTTGNFVQQKRKIGFDNSCQPVV